MTPTGRYVYGLVRAGVELGLGDVGLEHQGRPAPVRVLAEGPVAAVVSECPAREKVAPLRRNLEPHNRVVREVMGAATIVPMSFGHVARSEAKVRKMLRLNRDAILAEIERLDGMVEMGLKVRWDVENIFEYLVNADPALARARSEVFGRSRPPTAAEKIELGRMFEQRLTEERERHADRVVEMLRPRCADLRINPPKAEKVVADLAFLVRRDGVKAFEEMVYQVGGTFPGQYAFDYSGPWVPFNFVEIDLRVQDAE